MLGGIADCLPESQSSEGISKKEVSAGFELPQRLSSRSLGISEFLRKGMKVSQNLSHRAPACGLNLVGAQSYDNVDVSRLGGINRNGEFREWIDRLGELRRGR